MENLNQVLHSAAGVADEIGPNRYIINPQSCVCSDNKIRRIRGELIGKQLNERHFQYFLRPEEMPIFESLVTMPFGDALRSLKSNKRISRSIWGDAAFLYLVPANSYPAVTAIAKAEFGESVPYGAYIAFKGPGGVVIPYQADQEDILAEDWIVLD